MRFSSLLLAGSVLALTACAVGPDFEKPAAPGDKSYDQSALPEKTDGADSAQSFAVGGDIPAQWWTLFQSKPLDDLITHALKANPDIVAAEASLRAAGEDAEAAETNLFPSINGSFSSTRQKTASPSSGGIAPGSIYSLHNASVSVSYGVDLFGGTRREIEKEEATEDYSRYQLEAAYLSLAANVTTTAIQEASLRGQIDATKAIIAEQEKQLNIYKQQLEVGGIAKSAVLTQKATLAATRATLPALEKQLSVTRHQLAALGGELPTHDPQATFTLESLDLPKQLPVSLPSTLVEHRPDILAAEAHLHAASAAIGIAEVARLPEVTLSADIGSVANHLEKLFTTGGGIWSLGASVSEKLFDAGKLLHQERSAEAQYDVAAAQYRKTVIAAFQDVADTLRALQSDATAFELRVEAEHAAADNLALAQKRFDAGAISYNDLLTAEQTDQQARINLVQAKAQRLADTAALFQALGGGWWNRDGHIEPAAAPATPTNTTASGDEK